MAKLVIIGNWIQIWNTLDGMNLNSNDFIKVLKQFKQHSEAHLKL